MAKKFYYGGQAVLEGVMMRGRQAAVTAVRQPDGTVAMDVRALAPIFTGKWRQMPMVRGVIALIESVALGIQSLTYSANVALGEEKEQVSNGTIWLMMGVAFALAVGLFFILPLFLTRLMNPLISSSLVFTLVEGLVRVAIFLAYLKAAGLMRDIKRVFRYHGAEHKAVNAMEHGAPLEVESVRPFSTAHIRCGTSFLFTVMVISILVFSLVGRPSLAVMVLSRVLLVPVVAGLSYEFVFFGANHVNNALVKATLVPGLWLQKLTTGEPDDPQIEVACLALKKAAEMDQPAASPATMTGIPA